MNTLLPFTVWISVAVFNFPPGTSCGVSQSFSGPALHFLSVRRQTGLESKMNHSERGTVGQRKGEKERKRGSQSAG